VGLKKRLFVLDFREAASFVPRSESNHPSRCITRLREETQSSNDMKSRARLNSFTSHPEHNYRS